METITGVEKVVVKQKRVRPTKKEVVLYTHAGKKTYVVDWFNTIVEDMATVTVCPGLFGFTIVYSEPTTFYYDKDYNGQLGLADDIAAFGQPPEPEECE